MKNKFWSGVAVVLSMMMAAPAFAGRAEHRMVRQQRRIERGVKNGELTRHETKRLEKKEARLAVEDARLRAKDGGKLTVKDKLKLERQQDRVSRQIFRQKHDRQAQGGTPTPTPAPAPAPASAP
jgi:hypothetical protein